MQAQDISGGADFQMILTQLQPYGERFSKRRIRRDFNRSKKQLQHQVATRSRRAGRKLMSAARRQYYISDAYYDMRYAALHNEDIFLGSLLVSLVLGYAFAATALNLLLQTYIAATEIAAFTGVSIIILYSLVSTFYAVAAALLVVFITNMSSLSLFHGASRKYYRSLRSTIHQSLTVTGRVTGAWITFLALLFVPIGLAALGLLIWVYQTRPIVPDLLPWLVLATVIVSSWLITIAINYTLAPYVALFEPEVPLSQTFGRSRQLVRRRGRMFLLGMHIALILSLVTAYVASMVIAHVTPIASGIIMALTVPVLLLGFNGTLVAFYRKRRLARTR